VGRLERIHNVSAECNAEKMPLMWRIGAELPAPGGKRVWGQSPQCLRFLQFFNENDTFLGIIRLNSAEKYFHNFFNYTKSLTI